MTHADITDIRGLSLNAPSAAAAGPKETWIPACAGMTDREESTFEIVWVSLGGVTASTQFLSAFFSSRC
jgi:hypothetical protein